jgi:hypothetical protein
MGTAIEAAEKRQIIGDRPQKHPSAASMRRLVLSRFLSLFLHLLFP